MMFSKLAVGCYARRSSSRCLVHQARRNLVTRRRRGNPTSLLFRRDPSPLPASPLHPPQGLAAPFAPAQDDIGDYLGKASLSPWVPVPDPVARRMLEVAKAGPDDVHVELGSGDGRVNFHAIDPPFAVRRSIGIDIDEKLVGMADERLQRRHPQPDVSFHVADLLDPEQATPWDMVREATVITMYFVQEALLRIQPKLEQTLEGKQCRIVTCGYAMPQWNARWVEVILGLPVHLYEWGSMHHEHQARTLTDEEVRLAMLERPKVLQPEEELSPIGRQYEDAEKIEIPLIDPSEMVDGHWDDFDKEEDESHLENPAIEKWRKPE